MHRIVTLAATTLVALTAVFTAAALPESESVEKGVQFIRTTQQPDGGFGPPGQTIDAVFAIRAAGIDPTTVTAGGKSPADFLVATAASLTKPAEAAKAALGAVALGLDPTDVAGTSFIAAIADGYDQATGAFAEDPFSQSIAILGLACTGNSVPPAALDWLRDNQVDDGGWGFGASDPDTTAIALQALLAAGVPASDEDLLAAVLYLTNSQHDDAGWGYDGESNPTSTAFVVQALLAAGQDPAQGQVNPVSYLVSAQHPDGSFPGFDPALATSQTVPALAGRTFCNAPSTPLASEEPSAGVASTPSSSASNDEGLFEGTSLGIILAGVVAVLLVGGGIAVKARRS